MAIIELVLGLARKLDLKVTAEGVAHFRQASCLLEQGCTSLQGYFFGKRVPQERVRDFMLGHKRWQAHHNQDQQRPDPLL